MVKIKIQPRHRSLVSLERVPPGMLMQRYNLHELIANSPDEFFGEVGQRVFVIDENVQPSRALPTRVDVLAVDPSGDAVVVVVEDGKEQSSLARAITGAGLIEKWKPADFFERLTEERAAELRSFLDADENDINQKQRAVLVAEVFDVEVLTATKWLWQTNHVDTICLQVFLGVDPETGAEYLGCRDLSEEGAPPLIRSGGEVEAVLECRSGVMEHLEPLREDAPALLAAAGRIKSEPG